MQRTAILALAIVALATLAGLATLDGRDPGGAVLNMVVAGLLGIAGAAAGAHAANGKGATIVETGKGKTSPAIVVKQDDEDGSGVAGHAGAD